MILYADASDTPLVPLWVIATFVLLALTCWAAWEVYRAPMQDAEPSALDRADGHAPCHQRGCTGTAAYRVVPSSGIGVRDVCDSCFESGWRRGWWVAFGRLGGVL